MTIPSLLELCSRAFLDLVQRDAHKRKELLTLGTDLLDNIIPLVPPFLLELIQQEAGPSSCWFTLRCGRSQCAKLSGAKRSFDDISKPFENCCLNSIWKQHFDKRWPSGSKKHKYNDFLSPSEVKLLNLYEDEATIDWRQRFWEAHLQECLNEAIAQVSTFPFEGCLGSITMSMSLMQEAGYDLSKEELPKVSSLLTLKFNFQTFGHHAKYIRLRGALCTMELSVLFSACVKLQHLVLYHVATPIQADGLCLLLNQIKKSLRVLDFRHCRLSQDKLSKIHVSLMVDGADSHLLNHLFVISSSTFFEDTTASSQFMKVLHANRNLQSLVLLDNEIGIITAKKLFSIVLDALPHLTLFSLCDNELDGFSTLENMNGQFASLRILDLRSNKLDAHDIKELSPFFDLMPVLNQINLSENPIGDVGLRSFASKLCMLHLREISISTCNISKDSACFLFETLISLKHTLRSLKLSHNPLGRSIAVSLANFLQHGLVERLDVGDIGLGITGCIDLKDSLQGIPNLSHFILRENRMGYATAMLISKLRAEPNSLKVIDCSSNLLDSDCLSNIVSQLQMQTNVGDTLELIDLRHNLAESLEGFKDIKKPAILLSGLENLFDNDP